MTARTTTSGTGTTATVNAIWQDEGGAKTLALGTFALYAFLVTAITARYTKLLPPGAWLSIHRLALLIFLLSWLHGILSGTDSEPLRAMYVGAGLTVLLAATYRYWAFRKGRPTFETPALRHVRNQNALCSPERAGRCLPTETCSVFFV